MDSDGDMQDAYDSESLEDEDSDDMATIGDEGDEEGGLLREDDSEGSTASCQQGNYTVLSEADIRKQQEDDVSRVTDVLKVSRASSCILLHHYNWSVSKVHEEWFADEEKVRRAVGLLGKRPLEIKNARKLTCGICFETFSRNKLSYAACGHHFCRECWRGYIGTSIGDGPGCLMLRCPDPSCGAAVDQDMINTLAAEEDKEKYSRYLLRSYIEDNKKTKWCPSPGCEFAVGFVAGASYDVCCTCSHGFCWNCTEEAHRPVNCETVAKWILKNSAESENMNWILANSKPCPKCKRPIEKNHGCMHMTCTPPCKFEFCWLCLGTWSEHGERTGGFYACNRYEKAKQEGIYDEAERRREMAKNSLERYTHYYERWATNQSSRQKAIADLRSVQTGKLDALIKKQGLRESDLKFVIEAWLQIVECRRVLKWTYAYGYYLPEPEQTKRQFFEYLQGEAESGLERLHQCAEKELQVHLDALEPMREEFTAFKEKLADLTRVTRIYFENLVRALENGLEGVGSTDPKVKPSSSGSTESKAHYLDYDSWTCGHCTFVNPNSLTECQMCDHPNSR